MKQLEIAGDDIGVVWCEYAAGPTVKQYNLKGLEGSRVTWDGEGTGGVWGLGRGWCGEWCDPRLV